MTAAQHRELLPTHPTQPEAPAQGAGTVSRRRRWLTLGAGAAGLMGLGAFAAELRQRPHLDQPAYAAWQAQDAVAPEDLLAHLARCGTLAANAHNTQPWKLHLAPNRIEVHADPERSLGRADPQRVMQLMSLGCATENIRVAAAHFGLRPQVQHRCSDSFSGQGLCAQIVLTPTGAKAPHDLYESLFRRRTVRGAYDMQDRPDEQVLEQMLQACQFDSTQLSWHRAGSAGAKELALYTGYGVREWLADDGRHRDGMRWWRASREELVRQRDGLSIHTSDAPKVVMQAMDSLVGAGQWRGDFGRSGEIQSVNKVLDPTPVWGLITGGTHPNAVLQAGALLQRLYLLATSRNLAVHPLSYAPAMGLLQVYSKSLLPITDERQPLMVVRLGKPTSQVSQAVRRDLSTVLI